MHKFTIYQNRGGDFVATFQYNKEVLFRSEPQRSKGGALVVIAHMKEHGPTAPVEDNT